MKKTMKPTHITQDAVLRQLQHGTYTVEQLASTLNSSSSAVLRCIDMLVYSGRVRIDPRLTVDVGYQRVNERPAPREAIGTSIAGPQIGPNLSSALIGYDAQMRGRIALSMAARGR